MPTATIIPTLIILLSFLFWPYPIVSYAAEFNISSETILRAFERENSDEEKFAVIPVYEYLGVDYGDAEYGGFSFHANGWGRLDLGDQDYFQNDPEGYLMDGYVQYANPDIGLDVKLGRQHIFAGIVNESVDGVGFKANAGSYISLLAYGGYPVGYEDQNGRSGDSSFGGRMALEQVFPGEIGVSYQQLRNDSIFIDNRLGADMSLYLADRFIFSGVSFWNLETEGWGEHSYAIDLYSSRFLLKARYQMFQYADYFSSESDHQTLIYLQDTDEILSIVGGDFIFQQFHGFDAGLKLNHYTYDVRDEQSRYVAAVMNIYGRSQTSVGGEVGLMDGDSAENSYFLGRVYFYWDAPFSSLENWFLDGEFMYVGYEEEIYGRDNSIFSSLGCGRKILDDRLKIKISGDYSSDPYHDADIRFMTVVQYEY